MLTSEFRTHRDHADIVIVGNGIAGLTAALEARHLAPEKRIVIVTEQSHPTIYTPALKQFATGKLTQEQLLAFAPGTERARHIELINARVEKISSRGKFVYLDNQQQFGYGSLVLATGAHPNGLPVDMPGRGFDGVLTLHRLRDYLDLRRRLRLREVQQAVVIGGGTHALETVIGLLHQGIRVHWLIRSATFLPHMLDSAASEMAIDYSRRAGARVSTETQVVGIIGRVGTVVGVVTNQQQTLSCQMVLVCTGTSADTTLAEQCDVPLKHQRGFMVDTSLRTNVSGIFAVGDAAALWSPATKTYQPRAHWHAAVTQGRTVASVLTGNQWNAAPFGVPWHATQLGELSLLSVGDPLNGAIEAATVTDKRRGGYRRLSICQDRLVGYLAIGKTQPDGLTIKRIIDEELSIHNFERDLLTGELNARRYFAQQHFHEAQTLAVTGKLPVPDRTRVHNSVQMQQSSQMEAIRTTDQTDTLLPVSFMDEQCDEQDPLQKRVEQRAAHSCLIRSLKQQQHQSRRWIIPTMLPEGLVILAGKQQSEASWLSLSMGLAVASGERALESFNVEQGQVLYLAPGESEQHLQERLSQLVMMGASLHHAFDYSMPSPVLNDTDLAEIEAWLGLQPQPQLVIIDTPLQTSGIQEPTMRQGTPAKDIPEFYILEQLRNLAYTYHVGILVHVHTDTTTINRLIAAQADSAENGAVVDGILQLKCARGGRNAALSTVGQAYAQRRDIALSCTNGYWKQAEPTPIRPRATLSPARQAIINVLDTHNRPMKAAEIAQELGKTSGAVRPLLHVLEASGFIQLTTQGYTTSDATDKHLQLVDISQKQSIG